MSRDTQGRVAHHGRGWREPTDPASCSLPSGHLEGKCCGRMSQPPHLGCQYLTLIFRDAPKNECQKETLWVWSSLPEDRSPGLAVLVTSGSTGLRSSPLPPSPTVETVPTGDPQRIRFITLHWILRKSLLMRSHQKQIKAMVTESAVPLAAPVSF